jgi:type IV pilus assembly protein PilW
MRATQTGSSLIEAMLASALGLFLTFGFIQVYLSVQKTYHLQQAIIQLQENGRFAMHFLSSAVRMAGYAACDPENKEKGIMGYSLNISISPQDAVFASTSEITKPGGFLRGKRLISPLNSNRNTARHPNTSRDFLRDNALTETSVLKGERYIPAFLKNKQVKKNTDILQIGACIAQDNKTTLEQNFFFIGATERKNALGNTIYALYSAVTGNTRNELVSGIENMHLYYGVVQEKTDPDIARYVTADAVEDWEKVRAVKIDLLLSSDIPVLTQPASYTFAEKIFPADRFLHRSWHSYVGLRNMQ